jgi:uncharacterized protein with HEPN domain
MRDDGVYLQHIAESLSLIAEYLRREDGTLDDVLFYGDRRTQDAVLRRLETLTDAASHLSAGLKAHHASTAWRQIADFRNVLAHGYTEIDLDRVWQVVSVDLPGLSEIVDAQLRRRPGP